MNKILIVEDELSLQKILSEKLKIEGFEVFEAKNGEEGLEVAFKIQPDLILLDVVMPKMDGVTMLEKLREDKWGKNVPVIILTNLSSGTESTKSVEKKVSSYLVKTNWSLEDVVRKIKETL